MKWSGKSENIIIPLIAVILAFLIGGVIIAALGSSPVDAVGYLVQGAFGSKPKAICGNLNSENVDMTH